MATDNGKVRVRIQASQTVRYNQIVELTPAQWAQLKATPPEKLAQGGLDDLLDVSEITDADDYEDDFELFVVGTDGKPVRPFDRYEGS